MNQHVKQPFIIPAMFDPNHRASVALAAGTAKNLLVVARGGIGDQVCAFPTIAHLFKYFPAIGCTLTLAAHDGLAPLFAQFPWKRVFDMREEMPVWNNYFVMETINDLTAHDTWAHLADEFFNHCGVHTVNFASILATRGQLPVEEREIVIEPGAVSPEVVGIAEMQNAVVVHPGKHWQSKTFPKKWWDAVIKGLIAGGLDPVIIGAKRKDTGTVDVNTNGCVDLRGKTSLLETIWLLQRSKVLLTNDSAPLHMAASRDTAGTVGKCWVGFVATIKHPDYIMHWRYGKWAWRQQNLGLSGLWDAIDYSPGAVNPQIQGVEKVDHNLLMSWLPEPAAVVDWAKEKHATWTA